MTTLLLAWAELHQVMFHLNYVIVLILQEKFFQEKIYIYNSVYKDADIMFKIITGKDRLEEIIYKYNNIDYSIKYN